MQRISPERRQQIIQFAIANKYIELSPAEAGNDQIVINKLITTLMYEKQRHEWDAAHMVQLRNYIAEILPSAKNATKEQFESYIFKQETENNTYFGSYLSSTSDSEEENEFLALTEKVKKEKLALAARDQTRAQIKKMTLERASNAAKAAAKKAEAAKLDPTKAKAKRKTKNATPPVDRPKGSLRVDTPEGSVLFTLKDRTKIHYGPGVDMNRVTRDLNHLNQLLKKGYTIENALAELNVSRRNQDSEFTRFYVAEYRGNTHNTTTWNKPSRKLHRNDQTEINAPQFCASVHKAVGAGTISMFRDYAESKKQQAKKQNEYLEKAETLREILLTFREPRPYTYSNFSYSNLAYLIQNIYTQDYYGFHAMLSDNELLKSILMNDANPFYSMGDTPYHACKYAYGLKPYKGHEGDRLRARVRADGRSERPYSGVMYTSLHPLTDFTSDGPLHLITLNRNAEIQLTSELTTIPERESCFPAYMPENRICRKYVAKYPSFKGEYKQIFAYKYGLTKDLYDKFRVAYLSSRPHTQANKNVKKLLGEWLCSYQEVKMIDDAARLAEARGGVLIYRGCDGTFTLTPPIESVHKKDNLITKEIKDPVVAKITARQSFSNGKKIIEPVARSKSVKDIVASSNTNDSEISESPSVVTDGNHTMSLPLSLMLNAIKNSRYRALQHFVTLPEFCEALDEKFNYDEIRGITLIDYAEGDERAIEILSETAQYKRREAAYEDDCLSEQTDPDDFDDSETITFHRK